MAGTRQPVLAGSWYEADAGRLADAVDGYLAAAEAGKRPAGRCFLGVVPHAGHAYSGAAAGRFYGLLGDRRPSRVIILAPNHRTPLHRPAVDTAEAYGTPLGPVAVDTDAVAALTADDAFAADPGAHAGEHAVEIQLPFLQRLWPEPPPLVPVLVPPVPDGRRAATAAALDRILDDETLLLVSTDFTHYGAVYGYVPFTEDIPASLERLDSGAVVRLLGGDADGLLDYGRNTGITMCGLPAAVLALDCGLPEGYEATLLHYERSADRDGDFRMSVSYAALAFGTGPDGGGAS